MSVHDPSAYPKEGDVIAGKYRVERLLGAGGMGVVVAARHEMLDERVALKFLLPQALGSTEAVARFVREARAASKIKSDHVVRVTDVGQLDNGAPYMVMEYLEGHDLSERLKARGPMPIEMAVDFVLQACEALAEAHTLGIVHRDLKPANLFCVDRSDDQVAIKVLDFGISKVTSPDSHDMTRTSALMGSPYYMSPEQMQSSKGVDARTDIWSLGVILFELLTGRTPFAAATITEIAIKVAMEPATPVRSFRYDAPEGIEWVLMKALEKDRANRFQTVGEFAMALREFGSARARQSVDGILGTLRKAGLPTIMDSSPPHRGMPLMASDSVPPNASIVAADRPETAASWGQTGSESGASSKTPRAIAMAAAALLLTLVGVATLVVRLSRAIPADMSADFASGPSASSVPASGAGNAPTATAAPAPGPEGASAVSAPAASGAVGTASAPRGTTSGGPSAAPIANAPSKPASASTSPPRAPSGAVAPLPKPAVNAAPAAKSQCDPPYYYDKKGTRVFKQECL